MTQEDTIVGIDLGTTNSAVGVVDSGFPILLADEDGRRLVPSAVWFGPEGCEVGHAALRRRGVEPVVTSVKRLMGRRLQEAGDYPLPLRSAEGGGIAIDTGRGRSATPEEASAAILRELKRIAEWRLEREVRRAVITVPAYFNEGQRSATKRAGELAGWSVERLVAEPTAAALAYGLDRLGDESRVIVFDLGGGTFDISVLSLRDGVFEVLATAGDTRLGGDDFDRVLSDFVMADEGIRSAPGDQSSRLLVEAERVKRVLSEQEEAVWRMPFVDGVRSFERVVRRDEFAQLLAPGLERMERCCRRAMQDAGIGPGDLDAAVLVGGSTRIPAVRELAARVFEREPDLSQHPDEAVALGAAIQAGILNGTYRKVLLLDVTPLSLGVETLGGLMNVLIPRNTTIPCKAGELFTNARDGQRAMQVRVLQGERELARDNWELGNFEVEFAPAPRGNARVGVQFRLDESGLLEVLARDVATGRDTVLTIESAAVDVTDDAVERMVDESVEHAIEDMSLRVMTEARLKAEELLPAVETALRDGGAFIGAEERECIVAAKFAVEKALRSESAPALKAAVEALDTATEALAARFVEEAMAQRLQDQLGEGDDRPS